jgi:hypothetical protein
MPQPPSPQVAWAFAPPLGHADPQEPQWFGSEVVSKQPASPQSVGVVSGQAGTQTYESVPGSDWHDAAPPSAPQAMPQPPQFSGSDGRLQPPSHAWYPRGHPASAASPASASAVSTTASSTGPSGGSTASAAIASAAPSGPSLSSPVVASPPSAAGAEISGALLSSGPGIEPSQLHAHVSRVLYSSRPEIAAHAATQAPAATATAAQTIDLTPPTGPSCCRSGPSARRTTVLHNHNVVPPAPAPQSDLREDGGYPKLRTASNPRAGRCPRPTGRRRPRRTL